MQQNDQTIKVRRYFQAQNDTDADGVVDLFADNALVVNVNFPPFEGKSNVRKFCTDLYARTAMRNFRIQHVWTNGNTAAVQWTVNMTFRAGAKVGPFEIDRSFVVSLEGVNVFQFNGAGEIQELKIFHETTTVGNLAKTHAKA